MVDEHRKSGSFDCDVDRQSLPKRDIRSGDHAQLLKLEDQRANLLDRNNPPSPTCEPFGVSDTATAH